MPGNTKLILTVDTECSAGGWPQKKNAEPLGYDTMILGKIGSKEYGIRHIMDVVESYSIVVEFFVEPLCSYKFGISQLRDICQEVIDRGHSISLHIHPRWKLALNPSLLRLSDSMYDYGIDGQEQLIREGLHILSECGVKKVKAFRAGNLHGDVATYEAMRRVGVPISSNFCGAWNEEMSKKYRLPSKLNDVTLVNGILEIPVTSFRDLPRLRPNHLRQLQISAASNAEFRNVIKSAAEKRQRFLVVLLHTFEWILRGPNRTQKLENHILKRFHNLCEFLNEYRDEIDVCTFGSLDTDELYREIDKGNSVSKLFLNSSDIDGACRWISHGSRRIVRSFF